MSIKRLALFGGEPEFNRPLHVGTPNIGDTKRFLSRVETLLNRRLLTNRGPLVRELEQRVAELLNVKHCVTMSNGTAALEIATRALGFKGNAIVPALTFVATAHALEWQRVRPIFADIAPRTHHLDPRGIERLATSLTSGVIPVNLWGRTADIDAVTRRAANRGLAVVFDSSHAFGCTYKGKPVGGFGNAEVFSFHATKFVNTFEGGAVTTNDDALAERMRLMQNFGFVDRDTVIHVGINGKMNELEAAMGLTSLEAMDDFIAHNHANYCAYLEGVEDIDGLKLVEYDNSERNNYQYVVLEVDERATGLHRDPLMQALHSEGVDARRYFYPGCHRMEPYQSRPKPKGQDLTLTEAALSRVVTLPTGTAVTPGDIRRIVLLLQELLEHPADVVQRLAKQPHRATLSSV